MLGGPRGGTQRSNAPGERTAQQQGRHMLGRVGNNLGAAESARIAQRTGLSPEKIAQMAKRQGIGIKSPQGAGDLATEQGNQDTTNQIEGDVNNENNTEDGWSSRFDELNTQWEERFSDLESMFNDKLASMEEMKQKQDEALTKTPNLATDTSFDKGSIANDSLAHSGSFANNLERLFVTSKDDPSVVHDASTGYQKSAGSGGDRKTVDEFASGTSPNGAYVNDPRDYYNSGTVGASTTVDLDDEDALMHGSQVKRSYDDARQRTPSGQPLAGTALEFAL